MHSVNQAASELEAAFFFDASFSAAEPAHCGARLARASNLAVMAVSQHSARTLSDRGCRQRPIQSLKGERNQSPAVRPARLAAVAAVVVAAAPGGDCECGCSCSRVS